MFSMIILKSDGIRFSDYAVTLHTLHCILRIKHKYTMKSLIEHWEEIKERMMLGLDLLLMIKSVRLEG